MNILLTGGSGFLGKSILKEIHNASFTSLGRDKSNDIQCNLAESIPVFEESFHMVIHAAGKAHSVPKTSIERAAFFEVNVNGTLNLLKGLEVGPGMPNCFVFISTIAVYGLKSGEDVDEDAPLLASDPYGLSKVQSEEIVQNWCNEHGVKCTILRLPLLVGENPPGNLGAMINGIEKGFYLNIAGGHARKSMLLASDVGRLIPFISLIGGTYNLTDGHDPSFYELSTKIATKLNRGNPINIPFPLAKIFAKIGDVIGSKAPINSDKLEKLTKSLTFSTAKVRGVVNWVPNSVLDHI